MKRNSSSDFSKLPVNLYVVSKTEIESEDVVVWSRRSVLMAAGMLLLMPRHALAKMFQCGPGFQISILASLTGPLANVQTMYLEGAKEAVKKANAQGCGVTIAVRDAGSSPQKLILAALASERQDRASVIIGPLGPSLGRLIAQKASSALIFDISEMSPVGSRPENFVVLPYALFLTVNPEKRAESLRTVGRLAASIVLETIQSVARGTISSPVDLIEAMARRKFDSPKGALELNRTTGAFEFVK